jgi:hypothetical protein
LRKRRLDGVILRQIVEYFLDVRHGRHDVRAFGIGGEPRLHGHGKRGEAARVDDCAVIVHRIDERSDNDEFQPHGALGVPGDDRQLEDAVLRLNLLSIIIIPPVRIRAHIVGANLLRPLDARGNFLHALPSLPALCQSLPHAPTAPR